MNPPERLVIRLPADDAGEIVLIREAPVDVTPLLSASPAANAPGLVRTLFAICGEGHGHAAELAIEAARGDEAATPLLVAREVAGWAEIVREHGLRVALDWPRAIGAAPDHGAARAFLGRARDSDPGALASLIAETVTDAAPARWLATTTTPGDLSEWASATGTPAARLIAALLADPPRVPRLPEEAGSVVARNADHPLLDHGLPRGTPLARHVARLIDLCRAPRRIAALRSGEAAPIRGVRVGPGLGRATVACSRGALTHEVRLSGERIESYRVDPPTWRLFAPDGAAAESYRRLKSLPADERRRAAEVMTLALDPCVEHVIEVV